MTVNKVGIADRTKSKPVAVYARVSTTSQDCQNQLTEIRRFCLLRDWQIIEFVDSGFSGVLTEEKRPALKALLELARRREIQAVVVWDFSRFARSLRQLVEAVQNFGEWGVSFISIREGVDSSSANGRLILSIFGALGEFEVELIRERIHLGLQRSRAKGRVPGPCRKAVDVQKLKEAAAKGLSLRALALSFGINKDTARKLLKAPKGGV